MALTMSSAHIADQRVSICDALLPLNINHGPLYDHEREKKTFSLSLSSQFPLNLNSQLSICLFPNLSRIVCCGVGAPTFWLFEAPTPVFPLVLFFLPFPPVTLFAWRVDGLAGREEGRGVWPPTWIGPAPLSPQFLCPCLPCCLIRQGGRQGARRTR